MSAFTGAQAARIADGEYAELLLACVEDARRRIWASLFIFDVRPPRDVSGHALELLNALVERHRAGVDVRVLLAGHLTTADITTANLATGVLLDARGVPQRRVFDTGHGARRGSHAKTVVVDEHAVVGSHNWADDAFRLNVEDGVLLAGPPVDQLAHEFQRLWALGRGLPRDSAR